MLRNYPFLELILDMNRYMLNKESGKRQWIC